MPLSNPEIVVPTAMPSPEIVVPIAMEPVVTLDTVKVVSCQLPTNSAAALLTVNSNSNCFFKYLTVKHRDVIINEEMMMFDNWVT